MHDFYTNLICRLSNSFKYFFLFFCVIENSAFLPPGMSVSLLTRMGHLPAAANAGSLLPEATNPLFPPAGPASAMASSRTLLPAGSSGNLSSFSSGGNFALLGNLSLHSSPWTTGSGTRNPQRTSSPADDTMNSASMDMIEAQLAMRRAVVAAAAEHHQLQQSEGSVAMAGKSAGSSSAWNPFSLLPFIHGAAIASGATPSSLPTGSRSGVSGGESALSAWSAAAAAAAAAYASLLPAAGRTQNQDAGTRRGRGESKGDF